MRQPPAINQLIFAKPVRGLTQRQQRFVDRFLANGGRQGAAAVEAGYTEASADGIASRLMRNPLIQQAVMRSTLERIGLSAVPALHMIERLAQSAKSDYVKLEAARDLLDRAGFRPPDRVDHRLDHNLTVSLHLGSGEGGSETSASGYSDPPDTGKSSLEPDPLVIDADFGDERDEIP
jgi:hypothetical protein